MCNKEFPSKNIYNVYGHNFTKLNKRFGLFHFLLYSNNLMFEWESFWDLYFIRFCDKMEDKRL